MSWSMMFLHHLSVSTCMIAASKKKKSSVGFLHTSLEASGSLILDICTRILQPPPFYLLLYLCRHLKTLEVGCMRLCYAGL